MERRLKIVLASTSPRRAGLLEQLGLEFTVVDSGDDEAVPMGDPRETVEVNARTKARRGAEGIEEGLVLGADTLVLVDDMALGKASDPEDARRMLRLLRGREHIVITGFAVLDAAGGRMESGVAETGVQMRDFSDDEMEVYIGTGEPIGKAGGYAIQGVGALLVDGIRGDYSNVVGLPLARLGSMLRDFGVDPMS